MSEMGKKQSQILIGDGGRGSRQGSTFGVQWVFSGSADRPFWGIELVATTMILATDIENRDVGCQSKAKHCQIVTTDHLLSLAHARSHIKTLNTRPAGCGGASVAQAKAITIEISISTEYTCLLLSQKSSLVVFFFCPVYILHIVVLHTCYVLYTNFLYEQKRPSTFESLKPNRHGSQCERSPRPWRVCTEQVRLSQHPIVVLMADCRNCRLGQIWDPTLGAYRAQRLPLALSKSSVAANTMNGHVNEQSIYRPQTSASYASTASNSNSFNTPYTHSSTPTSPDSLFSPHSNSTSQMRAQRKPPPRVYFQNLPPEVYDCILQQLRVSHEDPWLQSCQTCYMRDLCSLSMTSRAWDKAVVKRL